MRHDVSGRLDVICETAATTLKAPIAQLNVLDEVFQSTVGRYPPDMRFDPLVLKDSACESVLLAAGPVVVPDAREHPLLCQRPPVAAGMRAYLGVPLVKEDQIVGTLCVVDFQPRNWRRYEVSTLEGLADLAWAAVSVP